MSRRAEFLVLSDVPDKRSQRPFNDFLFSAWSLLREDPIGPGESVGLGFTWFTRQSGWQVRLPYPWSIVKAGLVRRGAIDPKAHVYILRSEVVPISRTGEQAHLLVQMERN